MEVDEGEEAKVRSTTVTMLDVERMMTMMRVLSSWLEKKRPQGDWGVATVGSWYSTSSTWVRHA